MNRILRLALAAAAGFGVAMAASAQAQDQAQPPARAPQRLVIKVGTLAPNGTPWYDVIQEIDAGWKKVSAGQVRLTIFGGGIQGDETDIVRKMRIGQLQMGVLTTSGLQTISREMRALNIPLLFRDYEELDYVRGELNGRLEKALADKGFVVLNWGEAGWVKYFAKTPIPTIKALQELEMFVWAGDADAEDIYEAAGFKTVPLPVTELLTNLQRDRIQAFPAPAAVALANQWFGLARNMMDIRFAPIVGATIITKAAWDRIDPALRPTLLAVAQETGKRYIPRIRAIETEAIAAMVKRDLRVQTLTPQASREWQQTVEKFYPKIRGKLVPADLFDEVNRLVLEYRARPRTGPASMPEPARKPEPATTLGPMRQ
jgi:TRAP-type transport system periplasmic protein